MRIISCSVKISLKELKRRGVFVYEFYDWKELNPLGGKKKIKT